MNTAALDTDISKVSFTDNVLPEPLARTTLALPASNDSQLILEPLAPLIVHSSAVPDEMLMRDELLATIST